MEHARYRLCKHMVTWVVLHKIDSCLQEAVMSNRCSAQVCLVSNTSWRTSPMLCCEISMQEGEASS